MGIADRLFEPVEFFDESMELLAKIVTGDEKIEREKPDCPTPKLRSRTLVSSSRVGCTRAR